MMKWNHCSFPLIQSCNHSSTLADRPTVDLSLVATAVKFTAAFNLGLENTYPTQWNPQVPSHLVWMCLWTTINNFLSSFMMITLLIPRIQIWPSLPVFWKVLFIFCKENALSISKLFFFLGQCLTKQHEMYLIKNPANNKVIIFQHSVQCHMVTEQVGRIDA